MHLPVAIHHRDHVDIRRERRAKSRHDRRSDASVRRMTQHRDTRIGGGDLRRDQERFVRARVVHDEDGVDQVRNRPERPADETCFVVGGDYDRNPLVLKHAVPFTDLMLWLQ
jgi:hypothetical protein